jgi:hypothetical protein
MITDPEIREGLRYTDYFKEYNRPGFAAKIWEAYHKELVAADLLEEGISLLGACKDVMVLDVGLHHILESSVKGRVAKPRLNAVPLECDVEDWDVLDPRKHVDITESGQGSYPWPRL